MINHLLQSLKLGHVERNAIGKTVVDPHAGGQLQRGESQGFRTDHAASLSQYEIGAQRTQQRAFARHVGTGDQQDGTRRSNGDRVANTTSVREERMAKLDSGYHGVLRSKICDGRKVPVWLVMGHPGEA